MKDKKIAVVRKCVKGQPVILDNVFSTQRALSAYLHYIESCPTVDRIRMYDTKDNVITVKDLFNGTDWCVLQVNYKVDGKLHFTRYAIDMSPLNRCW